MSALTDDAPKARAQPAPLTVDVVWELVDESDGAEAALADLLFRRRSEETP